MKFYFLYLISGIKRYPKAYFLLFFTVLISVILISVTSITIDSINTSELRMAEALKLDFHLSGKLSREAHSYISNNSEVFLSSSEGFLAITEEYDLLFEDINKKHIEIINGTFPQNNEIIVPVSLIKSLPEGTHIGSSISFNLIAGKYKNKHDFIISGFYVPEENNKNLIYIDNQTAMEIAEKAGSDKNIYIDSIKLKNIYYLNTLKNNIQSSYGDLLTENNLMESGGIKKVFMFFILVIVSVMSILFIYNIINVQNKKRMYEYGVLALGATPKQITALGILEAFLLMLTALPIGIVIAIPIADLILNSVTFFTPYIENMISADNAGKLSIDNIYSTNLEVKTIIRILSACTITILTASLLPAIKINQIMPAQAFSGSFNKKLFFVKNSSDSWLKKKPVLWLAFLNIKRDKGQVISFGITIALAVIIFISTMHYIDYWKISVIDRYRNGIINITYYGNGGITEINDYVNKIKKLDGIITAEVMPTTNVINDGQRNYSVKMLSSDYAAKLKKYIIKGSIEDIFKKEFNVAILDNKNKYKIGDIIQQIVPSVSSENGVETKSFTVVCILKDKQFNYGNDQYIYISNDFYKYLPASESFGKINVICKISDVEKLKNEISKVDSTGFFVIDNTIDYQDLTIKVVIEFITFLTVFIFIAFLFVIFFMRNSYMKSRRKEFGILQAIGMSDYAIKKMILFECILYGVLASITGVALSLIPINLLHKALFKNPFSLDKYNIFIYIFVFAVCLILNFAACLIPIKSIEKINTIQMIQNLE